DDVGAVGVGAAGLVEASTGTLRYAPNIAWRDIPVATRLREALGLPCLVDNDANAAVWGEFRFCAGRGFQDMLLVIAGTGIGGGNGDLRRGRAKAWRGDRRTRQRLRPADRGGGRRNDGGGRPATGTGAEGAPFLGRGGGSSAGHPAGRGGVGQRRRTDRSGGP